MSPSIAEEEAVLTQAEIEGLISSSINALRSFGDKTSAADCWKSVEKKSSGGGMEKKSSDSFNSLITFDPLSHYTVSIHRILLFFVFFFNYNHQL